MNQCKFHEGQDVWVISGHYKTGFSIKQYVFEKQARNGLYWIRGKDNDDNFVMSPYLVFGSEKAAHASLISKFTFWLKREKQRYNEKDEVSK